MRLVPFARERLQKLAGEFAKFGTVGVVNTAINYAVFNALVLTLFSQSQLKATVVATVVATTASYFMNRHWTFRHRERSSLRREYVLFFAFNLAGLMIELGVMALAKYGLGLTGLLAINLAKTVGVGLGTIFRFWAYRTFVFLPTMQPAEQQATQPALVGATGVPVAPLAAGPAGPEFAEPDQVESEFVELTAPLESELDPPGYDQGAVDELGTTFDPARRA